MSKDFGAHLSDETYAKLVEDAGKVKLSKNQYLERLINGAELKELPGPEFFNDLKGLYLLIDKLEVLKIKNKDTANDPEFQKTLKRIQDFTFKMERYLL